MLNLPLVFAALSAGALGGIHCVGMCGGISMLLTDAGQKRSRPHTALNKIIPIAAVSASSSASANLAGSLSSRIYYQCLLQGGRITSYMLAGAAFGGLGAAGMVLKPYLPVQQALFLLGNLLLISLGLRLLGYLPHVSFLQNIWAGWSSRLTSRLPSLQQAAKYPFLLGMGWGCLPCGLLYAVAPFALLSGDAWSGALLMLIFGLAALPHLLLTQALMQQARKHSMMLGLRYVCAAILISVGALGLWYFDMKDMPDFLCLVAAG